jgi:hypothetical protein
MKKILFTFVALFVFITSVSANTQTDSVISSFKKVIEIGDLNIKVPKVIDVNLGNYPNGFFGVYNSKDKKFEPYILSEKNNNILLPNSITSNSLVDNLDNIFDNDFSNYAQLDLPQDGVGSFTSTYSFSENVTSKSMSIVLGQYVSLPNWISLSVLDGGKEKIVFSKIKPTGTTINFPETSAKQWVITIEYSQPLRINELQINNIKNLDRSLNLRFLAKPNLNYVIYSNPEVYLPQDVGETPNLSSNEDVSYINYKQIIDNLAYVAADSDKDGISDIVDNCLNVSNSKQEDENGNGRGDACDDYDKDGLINSADNCVNDTNFNQADTDGDGIGDICDGAESRLTEKYPWIVWGAIVFAFLVFIGLFSVSVMKIRKNKETDPKNSL